jgi:hypothetical protein
MRFCAIFGIVFLVLFAISSSGFCQGIPGCYPPRVPNVQPCPTSRPASPPPISRTVQVDVPLPCAPVCCGPQMSCPPNPCGPPVCAPRCPAQPVQVRVDVRVRPEAPKPCVPQTFCCENPPIFEPFFCRAAGLIQSLIVAPLGIGERFMGHPVPLPLPVPTPVPCWRQPVAMCSPCLQAPPVTKCMPSCPPVMCGPPAPPAKVRPSCVPLSARSYKPNGPFPR